MSHVTHTTRRARFTRLVWSHASSPLVRAVPCFRWSFTGLLVVLVMDVAIKFSDWSPARTLFPYATPAEKADVVKICYMSFMQGGANMRSCARSSSVTARVLT